MILARQGCRSLRVQVHRNGVRVLLSSLVSAIRNVTPVTVRSGRAPEAVRVCDITEDSRTVLPGSLFIARSGLKADGRSFASDAIALGAVAILTDDESLAFHSIAVLHCPDIMLGAAVAAEHFYGAASSKLTLMGVTGTNGKSTITYLIWKLMNAAGTRTGLIGTVMIDDGREVARAVMTTPPAIELSRTFATMSETGCSAAAMEVSSHALDQRRVGAFTFKIAAFTNLTGDHLDYHKTMENYAAAKARLFESLPPDGLAIVNADDPASARMVRDCPAKVLRCHTGAGEVSGLTARVETLSRSIRGMRLRMTGPWGCVEGDVGLIGEYNAMNVLQAVACAHAAGLAARQIEAALCTLDAPPGRLQRVSPEDCDITVFVDFAHTDDALINVLRETGRVMQGRADPNGPKLWAIFGCGGDKDRTKRPRMGNAAATHADRIVVTSDNPRTEAPNAIIDEILTGISAEHRAKVAVQENRARAIAHAIGEANAGDVIILAGKGHESTQIVSDGKGGTVATPFDEKAIALDALQARLNKKES